MNLVSLLDDNNKCTYHHWNHYTTLYTLLTWIWPLNVIVQLTAQYVTSYNWGIIKDGLTTLFWDLMVWSISEPELKLLISSKHHLMVWLDSHIWLPINGQS